MNNKTKFTWSSWWCRKIIWHGFLLRYFLDSVIPSSPVVWCLVCMNVSASVASLSITIWLSTFVAKYNPWCSLHLYFWRLLLYSNIIIFGGGIPPKMHTKKCVLFSTWVQCFIKIMPVRYIWYILSINSMFLCLLCSGDLSVWVGY